MQNFREKVAFVTGAASGIGLGIVDACVNAGMIVVMADVRGEVLNAQAATFTAQGARVIPVVLDVSNRAGWAAAAALVTREVGGIDLLCSNAGVNFVGPIHLSTYEDWDFALAVNLGGAVNAIHTFVPGMIARQREAHVVITSSVSGLFTGGGSGIYSTSKFALVGLAESLRADLAPYGIGVSVLCPGPVQSELFESTTAVRPPQFEATGAVPVVPAGVRRDDTPIFKTAPTGKDVGRRVLEGVRRNSLYILTHPEIRPVLEARSRALLDALPRESVDPARIEASARLLDSSLYRQANPE
jgi:NAD(P)-dependent dehydrogenase (short-subunit alcohol dehydrogenase family)